jgi:hypothetical protein
VLEEHEENITGRGGTCIIEWITRTKGRETYLRSPFPLLDIAVARFRSDVKKNKTFGKLKRQEEGSEGSKLRDIVTAVHFTVFADF